MELEQYLKFFASKKFETRYYVDFIGFLLEVHDAKNPLVATAEEREAIVPLLRDSIPFFEVGLRRFAACVERRDYEHAKMVVIALKHMFEVFGKDVEQLGVLMRSDAVISLEEFTEEVAISEQQSIRDSESSVKIINEEIVEINDKIVQNQVQEQKLHSDSQTSNNETDFSSSCTSGLALSPIFEQKLLSDSQTSSNETDSSSSSTSGSASNLQEEVSDYVPPAKRYRFEEAKVSQIAH